MALPGRNQKPATFRALTRVHAQILLMCALMASVGGYQIHTEARGPHWVAWLTREGSTKPDRSIVLVAASQDDAIARAEWWVRNGAEPALDAPGPRRADA